MSLQSFQELFVIAVFSGIECIFGMSLRSWVVARSHEPGEKARTKMDRARCAAMLGVWPRAVHKRRRPGRSSYQEMWEDRLYRATRHGTIPEDMTSGVTPKWWRPSLPLNVSEAEAERIAGKLVEAVQHAPEKEESSESKTRQHPPLC